MDRVCTQHDLELLLKVLFYTMTQETRTHLMGEVPGAYNRYCRRASGGDKSPGEAWGDLARALRDARRAEENSGG